MPKTYDYATSESLHSELDLLEDKARKALEDNGFQGLISSSRFFSMRYHGSDTAMIGSMAFAVRGQLDE